MIDIPVKVHPFKYVQNQIVKINYRLLSYTFFTMTSPNNFFKGISLMQGRTERGGGGRV